MKKEGRMKMSEVLKEAERLGEIAKKKVEAKIYERAIAERKKAMSINEDESLSEFINQEAIKEVEKEIKELEKKLMEASADKNTMTGGK
jgi:protein subunit release factor A